MSSANRSKVVDLRKRQGSAPKQSRKEEPPRTTLRRVSPVRTRRRKTRLIAFGVAVLLVLLATAGISYASYLPRYSVQTITVSGTQALDPALIQNYAQSIIHDGSRHFLSRANIFTYPRAVIEHDIVADFPRVSSALITKPSLWSTAIHIAITERQEYALWCTQDQTCYQMDQTGFIFTQASPLDASSTSSVFYGGLSDSVDSTASTTSPQASSGQAASSTAALISPIGQTFAPGHMPGIEVFLQLLGTAGFQTQSVTVENSQDFTVALTQGFYVKASFGEDAGQLVSNLQLVLSSDALQGKQDSLEYVDLRFGDRVYYKLKGDTQVENSSE